MAGQPGPAFGQPGCKFVPAIHVFTHNKGRESVDARHEAGHDG
jgi:hypothetical protein